MSPDQTRYYWGLWKGAVTADPSLDRKALHKALGLPESSKAFKQEHFDRWKSRCLALAQPENYRGQVATVAMPRTRRIWLAETLCVALGQEPAYAVATLRRMNRGGALQSGEIAPAELALADLGEEQLDAVLTALRKACRREWPTKPELLDAIDQHCREYDVDGSAAQAAAGEWLNVATVPPLAALYYDKLLIVLAAVKHVASQPF